MVQALADSLRAAQATAAGASAPRACPGGRNHGRRGDERGQRNTSKRSIRQDCCRPTSLARGRTARELVDTLRDHGSDAAGTLGRDAQAAGWLVRQPVSGRGLTTDDEAAWPTARLRRELTALSGIGQAKADAILLFGLGRPVYPVDRGTYRILVRHGWIDPSADYDEVSQLLIHAIGDANRRAGPAVGLDGRGGQGVLQARLAASARTARSSRSCPSRGRCNRIEPEPPRLRPWSARCRFMASYKLEGPKPARMYEVILPKKLGYFGKVQEVLEDLFDERAIRAIPFVKKSIAQTEERSRTSTRKPGSRSLCQASRGYSIYEMDGRYLSPSGPVDERVLVIRFIFHNPAGPADPGTDFLAAVARGGQSPGRPPLRQRAWRRGRNLVSRISSAAARDLAEEGPARE